MGAYSQGRVRRMIVGGVTRAVMERTRMPILLGVTDYDYAEETKGLQGGETVSLITPAEEAGKVQQAFGAAAKGGKAGGKGGDSKGGGKGSDGKGTSGGSGKSGPGGSGGGGERRGPPGQ